MIENNFGFGEKEGIHCPTEELAIKVLKIAHDKGYTWSSKRLYINEANWYTCKEKSYYCLNRGYLGHTDHNIYKYTIIEAEEFLKQHNISINNHKPYLVWN